MSGERGQIVAAVAVLTEYAAAYQCPHQPPERVSVRADAARQLIQPASFSRKGVGDAERGGRLDCLRYPRPQYQLQHRDRRWNQPLMKSIKVVAETLEDSGQFLGGRNLCLGRHCVFSSSTNRAAISRYHARDQ